MFWNICVILRNVRPTLLCSIIQELVSHHYLKKYDIKKHRRCFHFHFFPNLINISLTPSACIQRNMSDQNQLSQLIVDFPETGRQTKSSDIRSILSNSMPFQERRSVQISSTSTLAFIEYPSEADNRKKWISTEDQRQFRRNMMRDVVNTRRLLETTPYESISQEELYQFVGIESLLSIALVQRSFEQRMMHMRAILAEQERQLLLHDFDDGKLGQVSEIHSQCARERAHKIAASYSLMGNN